MILRSRNKSFSLILCIILFILCSCSVPEDVIISLSSEEETDEYIIAFGDIQGYTKSSSNIGYYEASIKWIEDNVKKGMRLNCILQDGDISETNADEEWTRFYDATQEIASKVPFFACVGNHDYDRNKDRFILGRNTTKINQYAGFPLTRKSIVAYYDSDNLENYVAKVSIHGKDVFLLVLEFAVRTEILQWAVEYVETHSDNLFVLMTHEWLTRELKRVSGDSYAFWQIGNGSSFSTPEQIWNSLVWPNNNIVCVLCGHNGFAGTLFSKNMAGRDVPQILFDIQLLPNGGDGIVQVWNFEHRSDSVKICAFDTIHQNWYMPDSTSVAFPFFIL